MHRSMRVIGSVQRGTAMSSILSLQGIYIAKKLKGCTAATHNSMKTQRKSQQRVDRRIEYGQVDFANYKRLLTIYYITQLILPHYIVLLRLKHPITTYCVLLHVSWLKILVSRTKRKSHLSGCLVHRHLPKRNFPQVRFESSV